jgi:lysozyme
MKCSDEGLKLLSEREGLELVAYPDPATGGEPWTIGVGHTGGVSEGDTCTVERAMEWLRLDVQTAEKGINNSVRVGLTQNQFDALVSLVFNIGCGNFRNSTLLKKLNDEDDAGAAEQFLVWKYANGKVMKGLEIRRKSEMEQFMKAGNDPVPKWSNL